jgi:parallel beta-helix repeat protein
MKKAPLTAIAVSTLLFFLVVGLNAANVASTGNPKTIVVPDDYSSIQLAVDSAAEGDTVFVKKGTYNQNVSISKQLSLIGEENKTTIIVGIESSSFFDPSSAVKVNADNVKISGFTITNSGIGINAQGNGIQIIANILETDSGISFVGSHGIIANNTLNESYGSITCHGSNNSIVGNTITDLDNFTPRGQIGVGGSFNTVDSNNAESLTFLNADINVISNNVCGRLELRVCSNNTVFGNIINRQYLYCIWLSEGSGNVFYQNVIANNSGTGVSLGSTISAAENNTFYHNVFRNNGVHVTSVQDACWSKNFWDNGKEGNYYDDYIGIDNNNDGIGDSPYTVQEIHYDLDLERDVTVVFFQDNYPLIAPYNSSSSLLSPSPSPTQQPTLEPTHPAQPTTPPNSTDPNLIIGIAAAVIVAVIIVSLTVYSKKYRKKKTAI